MRADPVMLARFAEASLGMIPDDVRTWALAVVSSCVRPSDRRAARDERLRLAAAMVEGNAWARMRRIQAELACGGTRGDPIGEVVREALAFDRAPRDPRHLLRILSGGVRGPRH